VRASARLAWKTAATRPVVAGPHGDDVVQQGRGQGVRKRSSRLRSTRPSDGCHSWRWPPPERTHRRNGQLLEFEFANKDAKRVETPSRRSSASGTCNERGVAGNVPNHKDGQQTSQETGPHTMPDHRSCCGRECSPKPTPGPRPTHPPPPPPPLRRVDADADSGAGRTSACPPSKCHQPLGPLQDRCQGRDRGSRRKIPRCQRGQSETPPMRVREADDYWPLVTTAQAQSGRRSDVGPGGEHEQGRRTHGPA